MLESATCDEIGDEITKHDIRAEHPTDGHEGNEGNEGQGNPCTGTVTLSLLSL